MRLKEIYIQNYKSLREVRFSPTPLSVLVGPNASGKSNFVDALDFLSDVYSSGLEVAVQRKGGYENIAHRKQRRTKAAIGFGMVAEFEVAFSEAPSFSVSVEHSFSLKASGAVPDFYINRRPTRNQRNAPAEYESIVREWLGGVLPNDQELILNRFQESTITKFASQAANWNVFQFSPAQTRLSAAPTPNPRLSRQGEHLPAIVDWLRQKHPELWAQVLSAMQEVVPDLEEITTDYTHTKTLGLHFKEASVGRPFTAEDVSAGTLHTLALLVAAADPRTTLLCIDELENSLHPWIINTLVRQFRELSANKTIFITTHSPTLIDALEPEEVWVVHKVEGETRISGLTELQPEIGAEFRAGKVRLSEVLGSGLVPPVVPGGVF